MSADHDIFTAKGLVTALAVCFAVHVLMVPLGLDSLAHVAGDGLTDMFNGAVDPSAGLDPHAGHDHGPSLDAH